MAADCVLSVILPVYNAMPWLPIAVRDMLKQVHAHDCIRNQFCFHTCLLAYTSHDSRMCAVRLCVVAAPLRIQWH